MADSRTHAKSGGLPMGRPSESTQIIASSEFIGLVADVILIFFLPLRRLAASTLRRARSRHARSYASRVHSFARHPVAACAANRCLIVTLHPKNSTRKRADIAIVANRGVAHEPGHHPAFARRAELDRPALADTVGLPTHTLAHEIERRDVFKPHDLLFVLQLCCIYVAHFKSPLLRLARPRGADAGWFAHLLSSHWGANLVLEKFIL